MSGKKKCNQFFSATIRDTMKEMGAEKTRPQVIAISAKRTIQNHPECKKYLDRPQEKIMLDENHWIFWSSKSFRLYRSQPCSLRIFFSKRKISTKTTTWKKTLRSLLQDRLHIVPRLGKTVEEKDGYWNIPLTDPTLILTLLHQRVANFLD